MKRNVIILVALFSLICSSLMAWELDRQCDFPANFYGIEVVGNDVWAVGTGGAVAHSTDNGENYSFVPTPAFNAATAEYIGVSGVSFKDESNGVICGEDGFAAITTDNGLTWTELTEVNALMGGGLVEQALYQSSGNIWLVGVEGKIVHSSDNGANWEFQTTGIAQWIYGISMDDSGTGYISGNNGSDDLAFIMKTTDFGANWVRITTPIEGNPHLYDVKHNGEVVVVSGEDGYVGLSNDGGATFSTISIDTVTDDMRFVTMNGDEGYVVGWHGAVIRTDDNWATVAEVATPFSDYFEEVKFDTNGNLVAAGWRGNILKSTDNGLNWVESVVPATYLLGVSVIDENNWYICGDYAYFLKTTDGGLTYEKIYIPNETEKLYDTWFFNQNVGLVSGDTDGVIHRTEDGGETWAEIEVTGGDRIYRFHFMDDLYGFAFSSSNDCLKTTDGGLTWNVLENGPSSSVYTGYVKDENNILAGGTGSSGNMWTSTDAGANWTRFGIGTKKVMGIAFLNDDIGVAVTKDGFIYYTTTGGMTEADWTVAVQVTVEDIMGVTINQDGNFVACAYAESASNITPSNVILVSEDNGVTWTEEIVPPTTFNPIRPQDIGYANDRTVVVGGYQLVYTDYNPTVTETPAVFFSEYIEGSSNNKALEVYNGTDAEISLADFRVNQSNNGADWAIIHTFPADAVIAAGDVWVIVTDQLDPTLFPLEDADEVLPYNADDKVVHFNGNDARALEYSADGTNWEIIDVFGIPTSDSFWAVAGVEEASHEKTLVRKESVLEGNLDWAASAGTNADDSEWIVYDQNTFNYLGSHNLPYTEGTLSGSVTLADGEGVITEVVITVGTETVSPLADGTYSLMLETGTYELSVALEGYTTFTQADVVITDGGVTTVDVALTAAEELNPPTNLAVDETTGLFTWASPDGSAGVDFSDDFESGDFSNWGEVIEGPGSAGENGFGYWNVASPDFTYESLAAMTDWGYNIDSWLISNDIAIEAGSSIAFDWASNYAWHVSPYNNGDLFVKVSTDGGVTWDTLWNYDDEPVWTNWVVYNTVLDLSTYAGQVVKIAFNAVGDDNADNMVDNVVIGSSRNYGTSAITASIICDPMDKNAPQEVLTYLNTRDLTGYKVYLDDTEVIEVTGNSHQFTALVAGTTFTAGVAAVYDGGISALETIVFVYNPIVELDTPTNLSIDSTSGEFNWEAPGTVEQGLTEGFEASVPPVNWTTDVTHTAGTWHQEGIVSFADGDVAPHEGEFQAAVAWEYGAQNEWLITPVFEAGANINFWSYSGAMGSTNLDHYYVKISTDGGSTWTILWDVVTDSQSASAWEEVNIDLSAYSGNIQLAWQAVDGDGQGLWYWWILDDISATSATGSRISFDGELKTRSNAIPSLTNTDAEFSRSGDVAAVTNTRDLTRDLTGYEVFLDGASMADVTETNYTFTNLTSGQEYIAGVKAVYDNGTSEMVTVSFTYDAISGDNNGIIAVTELRSNYPNPFNPATNICFSLKEAGNVTLEVYNAKGQKIKTLIDGEMAADNHVVNWNGDDNSGNKVSSGIYFYKMHSKKYSETKKMLMIK